MTVNVGCMECGWRGKRTFKDCDCYDTCNCPVYGHCPKCGEKPMTTRIIGIYKKHQKTNTD